MCILRVFDSQIATFDEKVDYVCDLLSGVILSSVNNTESTGYAELNWKRE